VSASAFSARRRPAACFEQLVSVPGDPPVDHESGRRESGRHESGHWHESGRHESGHWRDKLGRDEDSPNVGSVCVCVGVCVGE
jgi:hypothetical protein